MMITPESGSGPASASIGTPPSGSRSIRSTVKADTARFNPDVLNRLVVPRSSLRTRSKKRLPSTSQSPSRAVKIRRSVSSRTCVMSTASSLTRMVAGLRNRS
jgi:hypothetical protein